ncbi:MAG: hypothetical protein F2662_01270 [Actinobacteria bacterium]|uniref:Unannotated protein n=1 Tax=freshwater metagenome TaxID=449393 RepID=A0A6J6N2S2_9ZZZZ|nr:hypothetical protein [Actinomycetota bacterium]
MFDDLSSVMKRVLKFGALLVLAILVLGSLIGYFVAGISGILAALAGSLAALAFTGLTALSVLVGSKLSLPGFLGAVLGGWILKMVLFLIAFTILNKAEWLTREARPIVFFTIVVAVIGGLILDTRIVSKARLSADVKLP